MAENFTHQSQQFGPYMTLKVIGGSEQNAVYAAMHETTGRMVALRVFTVTHKAVNRALRECLDVIESLSHLELPNAIRILDYGHDDATIYIAMTVLNGGTLLERMKRRMLTVDEPQLPSPDEVLQMTERICDTLDAIHHLGMIHGQIQPHSIMFNDRGQAFLMEIGLTRILKIIYNLDATNSFNMTRYSPPELWKGVRPSPSTDQYALACIVYQLLTGVLPFDGKSIFDIMNAHTEDVAAPPHHVRQGLPGDLAMVFWQALAKPTDKRYPTMRAFYQDLQRCFDKYPASATDFFTFLID